MSFTPISTIILLCAAHIATLGFCAASVDIQELKTGNSLPNVIHSRSALGSPTDFARYGARLAYSTNYMRATLNAAAVRALSKPTMPDSSIFPPGWAALGRSINITPATATRRQRCHMLAAILGGSNRDSRNFFSCYWKTNNPGMRHFERLAHYIVFSSSPYYESVARVAPGSSKLDYVVRTTVPPGGSYPSDVTVTAVQIVGPYTRVAFKVKIQNKPDYTGTIEHLCSPWFNGIQTFALGPPAYRQRNLVELSANARLCAANQPRYGNFWFRNL